MENQIGSLLLLLLFINCESITSSGNESINQEVSEIDVQYSSNISDELQTLISGFSSITHFTPANEALVRINKDQIFTLVFALNDKNLPLLAALQENNSYDFNFENTALALLSTITSPFVDRAPSELTDTFKQHPDFNRLVERLDYLAHKNKSFIQDRSTLSLINSISENLASNFFVKTSISQPSFDHKISGTNSLNVHGNTKLPFKLSIKDLVRKGKRSSELYPGRNLESEIYHTSISGVSFEVDNGAFELTIESDLIASESRIQKLARDLILKSHSVLGLSTRNYSKSNLLDVSTQEIKLTKALTKNESIKLVQDHFNNNKVMFEDYFLKELNLSANHRDDFTLYLNGIRTLLLSQNTHSTFFNNDSFYDELDKLNSYNEYKTICFENSIQVNCQPSVSEISYSIGSEGCSENEYKITFGSGFFAPFGLDKGSKIKVNWEFGPNGESGFWLLPIKKSKRIVNGRTETTGCFNFGPLNELTLSLSIKDHDNRISNTSELIIYKPNNKAIRSTDEPSASLKM